MTATEIKNLLSTDSEFAMKMVIENNPYQVHANLETAGYEVNQDPDEMYQAIAGIINENQLALAYDILTVPWEFKVSGENYDQAVRELKSEKSGSEKWVTAALAAVSAILPMLGGSDATEPSQTQIAYMQYQAEQEAKRKRNTILWIVGGIVLLAVIVIILYFVLKRK